MLAKLCPVCQGCGRTSLDPLFGKPVPQPTYACSDSSAQGWTKCETCCGVGVIALIEGQCFSNGFSVQEYLETRLGPEA